MLLNVSKHRVKASEMPRHRYVYIENSPPKYLWGHPNPDKTSPDVADVGQRCCPCWRDAGSTADLLASASRALVGTCALERRPASSWVFGWYIWRYTCIYEAGWNTCFPLISNTLQKPWLSWGGELHILMTVEWVCWIWRGIAFISIDFGILGYTSRYTPQFDFGWWMMVDFCTSNCQLKNSHFASGADEVLNHGIQPWLIDLSVKTGPSIFFEPQEYVFEDWLGYCSET